MDRQFLRRQCLYLPLIAIPLLMASCATQETRLNSSIDVFYHLENPPRKLYVAPNGNDSWSGTLPVPNAQGNDGPFKTLQRAKEDIKREIQENSRPFSGVDVIVRDAQNQTQTMKFR